MRKKLSVIISNPAHYKPIMEIVQKESCGRGIENIIFLDAYPINTFAICNHNGVTEKVIESLTADALMILITESTK